MKSVAFCFDLDGTVTKEEILPQIAKELGIYEEIRILTEATLKGIFPFQSSFKLRVKLLSTSLISNVAKIVSKIKIDENIQKFIQNNRDDCFIITGNLDVWVNDFIENELGCKYFSSKANYSGDTLIGINSILNKGYPITELRNNYKKIITIGDSMNDCDMFEKADIQIAYGGVHTPTDSLISLSKYVVYDSKSLINLLELNLNEN